MQTKLKSLRKIHVRQQGQSDCGVACLLAVLRYYGGEESLENLRKLSGTNATGTTLLGLFHSAKQLGFDAEGCEADLNALAAHQQPCILHVVVEGGLHHYVVCYGTGQQQGQLKFFIGDPARGIMLLTRDELEKIWHSKACILYYPTDRIRKSAVIKNAKRRWVIELVKQDYPVLTIAAGLGIAIALAGLSMAIFSQRLIDDMLPKRSLVKVNVGAALLFAILLIKEGLSYLRQYFLLQQSKDFNTRIIQFFYLHLLQLPKPFFDTRKIGEFTARLNDTARIQRVISQLAGNVVIDVLVSLTTLVFLFSYSWEIAAMCALLLPVYFFLIYGHTRGIIAGQRNVMSSYALTEANYISTLQGIEPVKSHNKQALFAANNKTIYENFQNKIFALGKIQIKLSFLANSFGVAFITSILLFASYKVLANHLKPGELIAVLGMCGALLTSIANLALVFIPVSEARIAFDRMFEFTGAEPEKSLVDTSAPPFDSLEVNGLAFRFSGRSPLLKNVSFNVSKGEIIAIMGENGCGKSTLTQLLQKHNTWESGSITINSCLELGEISFESWRTIMGIVPQTIHIFNGSVLENIGFDDASVRPDKVLAFLEDYGFSAMIDQLPQSYMTVVGEEGVSLSGGQKQIIGLARALYHKPQLLLLDEATAAMDRRSEKFVLHLLMKLKKEMGIIFITHRLHVMKNFCDRIYILENGTVTSNGTHHQLLQSQNLYSAYWADLAQ